MYWIGVLLSVCSALLYVWFRSDIIDDLMARGIRKRDIYTRLKGARQFWFYQELEASYGLGLYGKLVCLYIPIWGSVTGLHLLLGWIPAISVAAALLMGGFSLFVSIMIFYTRIRGNRRAIGNPFLLLAWKKIKNRRGEYLRTDYYSTVLDLFLAIIPALYIWLVRCFYL